MSRANLPPRCYNRRRNRREHCRLVPLALPLDPAPCDDSVSSFSRSFSRRSPWMSRSADAVCSWRQAGGVVYLCQQTQNPWMRKYKSFNVAQENLS